MKKLLKCLSLLLIIPIVSVFALTGCKDKNNNNNTPTKYMSYENAGKVINSAFVALYGDTVPALPPQYDDPINPYPGMPSTPEEPVEISIPEKLTLNNSDLIYNTAASKTNNFTTTSGKTAISSNGLTLDLKTIFKTPLTIARSLFALEKYESLQTTMTYSYKYATDVYPSEMICNIKITVYSQSILIECVTTAYALEYESSFINIVFNNSYEATKIIYCLNIGDTSAESVAMTYADEEKPSEKPEEKPDEDAGGTTPVYQNFCFAVYDIANDSVSSMNYTAETAASDITALKTAVNTFKNSSGTKDSSVSLYSICKLLETF